jgi:peptidoglycan/LPS O-acetylase OafA/YrhL
LRNTPDLAPKRISHLDGLRGIAALTVFFTHLSLVVIPSIHNGLPHMARLHYEWMLAGTPVGIFWAANFAVCIFFVLSGVVLSYYYQKEGGHFIASCIRRYLRLIGPIFVASFIAFVLWRSGAMKNLEAQQITQEGWLPSQYNTAVPTLGYFIWDTFYGAFANGTSPINPPLWTMKYELAGSIGVFALFELVPQRGWRVAILFLFGVVTFETYYICFIGGVLIYELMLLKAEKNIELLPQTVFGMMLGLGAYFGAAPYNIDMTKNIWFWPLSGLHNVETWHQLGSIPFVLACGNLRQVVLFLQRPFCQFFGRISYSLYLIHDSIICSLMCGLIIGIYYLYKSPNIAIFSATFIIIPIVFVASRMLYLFVDRPSVHASARVAMWIRGERPRPLLADSQRLSRPATATLPVREVRAADRNA